MGSIQSQESLNIKEGDRKPELERCKVRKTQMAIAGFEDGGRGQEPRKRNAASRSRKKKGNRLFSRASRKEYSPAGSLILIH